jgi:hypothetical protein
MTSLQAALSALRTQLALDIDDDTQQTLYEYWLKKDAWCARSEALPLAIGLDPLRWKTARAGRQIGPHERALWESFAAYLGSDGIREPAIAPRKLRQWARQHDLRISPSLTRLLDFIGTILPAEADAGADQTHDFAPAIRLAEDRLAILGAALSAVTRCPARCVNAAGDYDGDLIAELVFRQAVWWFPLRPPGLTQQEAAALIGRWLASPTGLG